MERELKNYKLKHAKKSKAKKVIITFCIIIILLTLLLFGLYYFFGGNYLKISADKENTIEVNVGNDDYEKVNVTCKFLGKEVKNIKLIKDIDINKIGEQESEYECSKSFFKKNIIIKYNIVDTILPILEVDSEDNVSIYVGDEYKEPNVKATDNYDGDITDKIEKNGSVDNTKVGTYEIEYKVSDSSGNETSKKITVEVKNKPATKSGGVKSSGNLACGNPGTIYLTFDDGPNGYYTPVILDVLKKYNVKATFFVTSAGPDNLIKREFDEGHAIGLHSSTHAYNQIYVSSEAFWSDMQIVSDRVERLTGKKTNLIRFPGGVSNTVSRHYNVGIMSQLAKEVEEKGYGYFDWNISSGDAGGTTDPTQEYYNVINNLSKSRGNVILMHDIKKHTSEAIDSIVKYGIDNGYTFDVLTKDIICHQNINN